MKFPDFLTHPARREKSLEQPVQPVLQQKIYYYQDYIPPAISTNPNVYDAIRLGTLVTGPGTSGLTYQAWHQEDFNSAVFACLNAIGVSYPEATCKVYRQTDPGTRDELPDHPLQQLLNTPNPYITREDLWWWTQWSKHVAGNAYWRKIRSGGPGSNVVQLWPISPLNIVPVLLREDALSGLFISYYAYTFDPHQQPEMIPPEDIVHFRLGIDDRDHRLGVSPLARLVREIAGDEQAHAWQTSMLENGGTIGMLIQVPQDSSITMEQAEDMKTRFEERFSGTNRGRTGVLMGGAEAKPYGFSPEQMDMKALHRIPEERIAAVLRVPAIIAGLGAGLDRSTYANFREAREMFAELTLMPLYGFDAAALNMQLTPEFSSDPNILVAFDVTDLRAFQEDEDAKWKRLDQAVRTGWVRRNEARTDVGLPPDMDDNAPLPSTAFPPAQQQLPGAEGQQGEQDTQLPGTKQRPIPHEQATTMLPDVLQALVTLGQPATTEDLQRYFDGQQQRVTRELERF